MNLKVIQYKKVYIGFSVLMVLLSLIFFFTIKLNLGIDFKGGDLLQVKYEKSVNKDTINKELDELSGKIPQLKARKIQFSEEDNTMILRTGQLEESKKSVLLSSLTEKTGKYEIIRYDTVGATIGKELTQNAVWALIIGSILIIIYVTVRFEFIYAIAGIATLLHDVIISIGLIALLRYEVDTPFIAAILTILGYSINDTIVIFDRIRENDKKNQSEKNKKDFAKVIEESVNQVCMRSLYTSITTLFSITILLIFGGESLRTFNMTLFIGMIFGSYSSIFVASPLVYIMRKFRIVKKDDSGKDTGKKKVKKMVNGYDADEKVLV